MTIDQWIQLYGNNLDPATVRAARYLERNGQVFLIHFGVLNAVHRARILRREKKVKHGLRRRLTEQGFRA